MKSSTFFLVLSLIFLAYLEYKLHEVSIKYVVIGSEEIIPGGSLAGAKTGGG